MNSDGVGPGGWHTRWMLLIGLVMGVFGSVVADGEVSFAEPGSGRKVSSYTVELPTARDRRETFAVPADCAVAIDKVWRHGAQQWGNRVDRSTWWKVRRDCDYVGFLGSYSRSPSHDYVAGYDFMNAYLRDLPVRLRCERAPDSSLIPGCDNLTPPEVADLAQILPVVDGADAPAGTPPCRMQDGIFRGRIVQGANGIHCEADPDAPGFRVISIDYADVNGDDYRDVVLRLLPLGIGMPRAPLLLPLTRTQPDGPFSIPRDLRLPSALPR